VAAAADSGARTVTAVQYLADGHELVSAGAADGLVKFWDFRVWLARGDTHFDRK
jgi:hypothetical protein